MRGSRGSGHFLRERLRHGRLEPERDERLFGLPQIQRGLGRDLDRGQCVAAHHRARHHLLVLLSLHQLLQGREVGVVDPGSLEGFPVLRAQVLGAESDFSFLLHLLAARGRRRGRPRGVLQHVLRRLLREARAETPHRERALDLARVPDERDFLRVLQRVRQTGLVLLVHGGTGRRRLPRRHEHPQRARRFHAPKPHTVQLLAVLPRDDARAAVVVGVHALPREPLRLALREAAVHEHHLDLSSLLLERFG
mmetsp:Transcript_27006/g.68059  ORF Transcript_27006/g.68059 Transcript_27006/m.68059 type:complete len:251 (+) Transcript_27006:653-1405(+)